MTAIYDDHGIRFAYPGDWDVEVTDDGPIRTVSVQSPSGLAFALVTTDESSPLPSPDEVADQALEAMREEYPTLDSAPARDSIGDHQAVGHDVEFITLDMTNTCAIRCFQTDRRTVLIFGQWSDLEGKDAEDHIRDICRTVEETDG